MARARTAAKPRPRAVKPITFVAVEEVFQPQVQVRATRDLNGWVNHAKRIKWSLGAGQVGWLDQDKAREFSIKGYVDIVDGTVEPASEDEIAEVMSTVTVIGLGAS